MALARATIVKTVMGNKRVHYGTATVASGDTSGTIATGLRSVETFLMGGEVVAYTVSSGTVTVTFEDPGGSAGTIGWLAIGY